MQCSFEQFFSSFATLFYFIYFFILHSFMNLFLFLIIPGHAETLIFDVLKVEWSLAVASLPSSITTNKVSYIDFVFAV